MDCLECGNNKKNAKCKNNMCNSCCVRLSGYDIREFKYCSVHSYSLKKQEEAKKERKKQKEIQKKNFLETLFEEEEEERKEKEKIYKFEPENYYEKESLNYIDEFDYECSFVDLTSEKKTNNINVLVDKFIYSSDEFNQLTDFKNEIKDIEIIVKKNEKNKLKRKRNEEEDACLFQRIEKKQKKLNDMMFKCNRMKRDDVNLDKEIKNDDEKIKKFFEERKKKEEENICSICCDNKRNVALSTCGHLYCSSCLNNLNIKVCPLCNVNFGMGNVIKIFL